MKKTSIIIPTFNGRELLKDCIYSIKRHTNEPYEIIVVDNGSSDGTVDICRQEGITFISLANNIGFPAACNKGLKIATGDTLLLLNNDVIVTRNWLQNMLNCLNSETKIGIVGPLTNYASGKQQIDMPYTSLEEMSNQLNEPDASKWLQVDRIVGLCFLFKRELMDRIGLLDERYSPGHFEDDDYCYRARNAGYTFRIAGDVFVFHHGSASFAKQDMSQVKHLIDTNKQKFMDKWGVDPTIYV
ncbi:glycosyltransferase family 2 protein [Paenibacillus sp. JNUCC32]|uniref:glycosyltransferase family 2 protein n=1 Tax=Paenibacillus TaxID=44249 RepID=UPI000BBD8A17|nr:MULTISPECIES: glycosyltransferase family 2 protein [Paenibacillus]PCL92288.1 glycosyl transferase family 2 [Paenibacillus lautus]QOT08091.1 glycosyltransferase family 2 protein [Paenibacillus sp. JNUCC-32]GIP06762.1 glycosyl transferase [Paenibacillus lautus]